MINDRQHPIAIWLTMLVGTIIEVSGLVGCESAEEAPKGQIDIEKSRQEHINVSKREQIES
jgi:hypothetical protein